VLMEQVSHHKAPRFIVIDHGNFIHIKNIQHRSIRISPNGIISRPESPTLFLTNRASKYGCPGN
jgi:hypothetical protein